MKKEQKSQLGFGLIEALLLIIAVALVVFVGYYVWHTQKQTDKTLSQASSTSQNTSPQLTKKTAQTKYLNITEWGVRVPYTGSDNYTYKYDSAHPDLINIISANLSEKYGCTQEGAGLVARYSSSYVYPSGTGYSGETIQQVALQNPDMFYKAGSNYYSWAHDQDACFSSGNGSAAAVAAQNQASSTFQSFLKNIQPTPQ